MEEREKRGREKKLKKKGKRNETSRIFSVYSYTDARRLVDIEPVAPLVPSVGVPAQGRSRADLKGPGAGPEL